MRESGKQRPQNKLNKNEIALRSVFAVFPIGVAIVTGNRKIEWANSSFAAITKYSLEDIVNRSPREFYRTDEEFARVGKIIYRKVLRGGTGVVDTKWIRKDGKLLDIHMTVAAIDANDLSRGIIITAEDITRRKEMEARLLESEERYRTAVEFSNDGVALIKDGLHIYVNQKFVEMFGYDSREEVIGKPSTIIIHPEYLAEALSYREKRMKGEPAPDRFEFRGIRRDGTDIMVEISIASTIFHGETVFLAFLRDITQRKQYEEALRASEEKYRNVVENSLSGFYILQDNVFRFVNKRLCEIYGYTYEEIVDKAGPFDNIVPEDREMVEENMRKRLLGEQADEEYEFRTIRKDGQVITVRLMAGSIIYRGKPALTGTVIDITKEKTLESQLLQSQKMEVIGTLANGIAHDFKNILEGIMGFAKMIQKDADPDSSQYRRIGLVLKGAQKGRDFVRQILSFSRQTPEEQKPVVLSETIKEGLMLLKPVLPATIEIKLTSSTDEDTVFADSSQLHQILMNLCTNAAHAMCPQGGLLEISISRADFTEKDIFPCPGMKAGSYVVMEVCDNGRGMEPGVLERIFDPFFTTKEKQVGTGLGLTVVHGIVKSHNGYISVQSKPGQGTVFRIYFPKFECKRDSVNEKMIQPSGG